MEHLIKNGNKQLAIDNGQRILNKSPKASRFSPGFTIIEIMIVLAIIGILLAIAQPSFQQYTIRAKEAVLKENLFTLRDVIDQYYGDKGRYPDTLGDLVTNGYIRKVPEDPFTKSSETWVAIPPDAGEGGIYDVHSGSDLVALDGTSYNEW